MEEKIIDEFDKLVIGDCFAGGIFNDNKLQKMYSAGFKDGINNSKNNVRQFIKQKLSEYRQSLIASIEEEMPKRNTSNDGAGMGFEESVEGYNSCLEEVKSILNKYK